MAEITLKIDGMSCQHCVAAVKKAVDALEGVDSSDVAVGSAKVAFDDARTNRDTIAAAIQTAGYKIIA